MREALSLGISIVPDSSSSRCFRGDPQRTWGRPWSHNGGALPAPMHRALAE